MSVSDIHSYIQARKFQAVVFGGNIPKHEAESKKPEFGHGTIYFGVVRNLK